MSNNSRPSNDGGNNREIPVEYINQEDMRAQIEKNYPDFSLKCILTKDLPRIIINKLKLVFTDYIPEILNGISMVLKSGSKEKKTSPTQLGTTINDSNGINGKKPGRKPRKHTTIPNTGVEGTEQKDREDE